MKIELLLILDGFNINNNKVFSKDFLIFNLKKLKII